MIDNMQCPVCGLFVKIEFNEIDQAYDCCCPNTSLINDRDFFHFHLVIGNENIILHLLLEKLDKYYICFNKKSNTYLVESLQDSIIKAYLEFEFNENIDSFNFKNIENTIRNYLLFE